MMKMTDRRLQNEYKEFRRNVPESISLLKCDNLYQWFIKIEAPEDSVYKGLSYNLTMKFPKDYPFKPPEVYFLTPIYHPNVDNKGKLKISLVRCDWTPAIVAYTLAMIIQTLLNDPEPPADGMNVAVLANSEAYRLFYEDKNIYTDKVIEQHKRGTYEKY